MSLSGGLIEVPVRLLVIIGLQLRVSVSSIVGVDGLTLSWLQFLRVCPLGVCMTQDRGVYVIRTVLSATGFPLVVIQTSVLSEISGRSLTL